MNHSPMAGIAAQGPLPAGMLRIGKGNQERYVWPVHLPGWLALGWRVAGAEAPSDGITAAGGPTVGVAPAEPPASSTAAAGELFEPDEAKPASARGRRGRRRKDEAQPEAPADPGASTVNDNSNDGNDAIGPETNSEPLQQGEPPAAAIEAPDPDSTAEGAVALGALPDDLFSDPLI